jgi:hypothetical protein
MRAVPVPGSGTALIQPASRGRLMDTKKAVAIVAIQRIYLREPKARVAGNAIDGGTKPDRTHDVWDITERLGVKACQ